MVLGIASLPYKPLIVVAIMAWCYRFIAKSLMSNDDIPSIKELLESDWGEKTFYLIIFANGIGFTAYFFIYTWLNINEGTAI